jgi:hypothetical protein
MFMPSRLLAAASALLVLSPAALAEGPDLGRLATARRTSHLGTSALTPVARGYHPAVGRRSKARRFTPTNVSPAMVRRESANPTTSSSADAEA